MFATFDEVIAHAKALEGFSFKNLPKEETLFGEKNEKIFSLTSKNSGLSITFDIINSVEFFYWIKNSKGEVLYEIRSSEEFNKVEDWDSLLNVDVLVSNLISEFQRLLPKLKTQISSANKKYQKTRKDRYFFQVQSLEKTFNAASKAIYRLSTKSVA